MHARLVIIHRVARLNPVERKVLRSCMLLGLALTLLVLATDASGLLRSLERFLYDQRARFCQVFTPPPTDSLIHIDIDDQSLEVIGNWPWPRTWLAQLVDELEVAGAKAVGLDMIFSEPQRPRAILDAQQPGADADAPAYALAGVVDDDANLARALERLPASLLSAAFRPAIPLEQHSPLYRDVYQRLYENPELEAPELAAAISPEDPAAMEPRISGMLVRVRRRAIFRRVAEALRMAGEDEPSAAELRASLMPRATAHRATTGAVRELERQVAQVRAAEALYRLLPPVPPDVTWLAPHEIDLAPIPTLARSVTTTGFFNYFADGDGTVRSSPLLIESGGHLVPHMGLSLACAMLEVDLADLRLEPDALIMPLPDGTERRVPIRTWHRSRGLEERDEPPLASTMEVPWFGGERWERMYEQADPSEGRRHIPIVEVWEIGQMRERIRANIAEADRFLEFLLVETLDPSLWQAFKARKLAPDDFQSRLAVYRDTLREVDGFYDIDAIRSVPEATRGPRETRVLNTYDLLTRVQPVLAELDADLDSARGKLRNAVRDKAVLIGWTATGVSADFVPTSLHAKCPGVVIHGVIYSALMTGEFWTRAPVWVDRAAILLIGLFCSLLIARMSPLASVLAMAGLVLLFAMGNALVLFDRYNLVTAAAGPLVVMAVVWAGLTVDRFVIERRERNRITARFRSYVDPALVQYVIEHPEQASLEGEVREMTVVFTDLAGFTTLSERLREATVGLLNEYIRLMVPVIEHRRGFVNKFLGDGIMFFYNAPYRNEQHAADAVATILESQEVLGRFNASLAQRGLPSVKMRAGISTGQMVVGDAGGAGRSDYTVLGDAVNLSARLESANKATGTLTMISSRTAEMLGGRFLLRPIARLVVMGKQEAVAVYEPLGWTEQATPDAKALAEATAAMVEAYWAGRFGEALVAADVLEARWGASKLAALYREHCRRHQASPPEEFSGAIVLTEK